MASKKKTDYKKLEEKLSLSKKSMWSGLTEKKKKTVFNFAENYKKFLNENKTERHCAEYARKALVKKKFKPLSEINGIQAGDGIFDVIKGKAVVAARVGKNPSALRIIGSHIDSPRLDIKPNPLYEDSSLALFQSHYYGGVKKYHWVNVPLAMLGVAFTKKGKKIEFEIGNREDDPVFIIPDLLPHLSKDQRSKTLEKAVEGETLNIVCGHIPVRDPDVKKAVKLTVLEYFHNHYGLIEEDFTCAEIEFVPAARPRDVGFDRGLIAAYAHDDKICAYASLKAFLETEEPDETTVLLFVDKEEIGSVGNTAARSYILADFFREYAKKAGGKDGAALLRNAVSLSADVTAGMNPNYKSVHDPENVSLLGHGISIEKYGGGGGKYSTNDAHAEYMQYLRSLADRSKIPWQTGELGKIDIGGGGTIAMYMARFGMDCVDAGPCLLGMHSPYEVVSKADLFASYEYYKAFYKDKG